MIGLKQRRDNGAIRASKYYPNTLYTKLSLTKGVRGEWGPGIKVNSKVPIFDRHLASIYYRHGRPYDYMWLNGHRSDKMR
jgi:hypothetical protein